MPTEERRRRLEQVACARQQGVLVLEDIHDPHNAAAVLRTADAVGLQSVSLIFEQEQHFNPRKVGKTSSASANLWLDFRVFRSARACLEELRGAGYRIVATVPDESAPALLDFDFCQPRLALLFGNEHRGLSEQALALADARVRVPMQGMVRTLNLSVTAALCLYELLRQRQAAGMERFLLPPAERQALVARWLEREVPGPQITGPAADSSELDPVLRALGIKS